MKSYSKMILFTCMLLLLSLLLACQSQESKPSAPQFLWESFQRFWGKYETSYVTLKDARKTQQGYLVDYGFGVLLSIYMQDKVITGVEVTFPETKQSNEGARQFLRLIEQFMQMGTFRWSSEETAIMRNFFGPMSKVKKELKFKTSHFTRYFDGLTWYFRLDFIPNTLEMWANLPLPIKKPILEVESDTREFQSQPPGH